MRAQISLLALILGACSAAPEDTDTDTDPPPPTHSVRYVLDLQTHYWDWGGSHGLAANKSWLYVEHTTGTLPPMQVPAPGTCTADSSLFVPTPYPAGEPIDGVGDRPRWQLPAEGSGELQTLVDGLYTGTGVRENGTGIAYQEFLGDGYVLDDMGPLQGMATLGMATVDEVFVDGQREDTVPGPIVKGTAYDLSWQASDWDDSFVMVRTHYLGDIRAEVVCGTTGMADYTLSDDAWSLMPALGEDEVYAIYVGFDRRAPLVHDDPYWQVEGVSRLLHAWDPS